MLLVVPAIARLFTLGQRGLVEEGASPPTGVEDPGSTRA